MEVHSLGTITLEVIEIELVSKFYSVCSVCWTYMWGSVQAVTSGRSLVIRCARVQPSEVQQGVVRLEELVFGAVEMLLE